MTAADLIRMAYARLAGLKMSLDQRKAAYAGAIANREFIEDFHDIITDLENLGVQLDKFRVPSRAIEAGGGGTSGWCDLDFLISKVGGLLNLFTVSEDKKKIGFLDRE